MVPEPLRRPRPEAAPEIPGYRVEGVIGRGATGTVYRARQLAVDRVVALKILHPELAAKRSVVQRLQREARTTARLAHPHVVSAIDMGEAGGRWWYAMELVDGPSLALTLRQEGRITERAALRLFVPLCEALEHLWEHGVVHRDIKPANILIDRVAGARLADLGLAFADDDPSLTESGGTLGTPHYMSPEQAVDPGAADVRSDIWSFGATLYHAVTGHPPFEGTSTAEVLSAVLYARVPDPQVYAPSLSRGLVLVLRKCLTRDPAHRYQSPRELLADLERVRERRAPEIRLRSLDPLERAPRPWLKPLLWGSAAVLALLLTALAAARSGRGEKESPEDGVQAAVRFEPLEELVHRIELRPENAGEQLRDLEELRERVPAVFLARFGEVHDELKERLRADLTARYDRWDAEIARRIGAGDLVGAREALGYALPREVTAATGFTQDEAEQRFGLLRARRVGLEDRIDAAEEQLGAAVAEKLAQSRVRMIEEAERLHDLGSYRSALATLDADDAALLAEVGYGGYRFPPALLEELLAETRGELAVARQRIAFAWEALDLELADWIDRRAERLRETLTESEARVSSAADELVQSFDAELFERGLERGEMAAGISRVALDRLAERAGELATLEDELLRERVRREFQLNRELDRTGWEQRDYPAVMALWNEFRRALDAEAGDPEKPWRQELQRRAELRVREAQLLQGLLEDAAAGVVAADGTVRELHGRGIAEEGRIAAGVDPLLEGFELVPEHGAAYRLSLATLAPNDVLALAGIPLIDEDLTPEQRVVAAAFRYRENALARAEATLRSGELPLGTELAELADDLKTLVVGALEREEDAAEERAAAVGELLARVTPDAIREQPDRALMAINRLLSEYRDEKSVSLLRADLLDKKRKLENRERSFQESYEPHRLIEQQGGRVRLGFDFETQEVGRWEAGTWRFDGAGWSAPSNAAEWAELERGFGARLILRSPLDIGQKVVLTLEFEVVDPIAPAQLLVVSIAGFHVALSGRGLPDGGGKERVTIGAGDLAGFLADVRGGRGEVAAALLTPGKPQKLVLLVHPGRGTVRVELDGALLAERDLPHRIPDPPSLVLRSWDPIRVRSAEIEAARY